MKKGQFIVVEGIEGAGKSSAISVIEAVLEKNGIPYIKTREPGGTPLAESLRDIVNLKGINILDFGCGTGLLTEKLSPVTNQIIALDSSQKMIDVLNDKNLINVSTLSALLSKESIGVNHLLHEKFDLIVASSVCSFLPNYESTLILLKSLLTKNGVFVQWDWLAQEEGSSTGLTNRRVHSALESAGFNTINITQPFSLESSKGSMDVLMASARNA